MYNNLNYKHYLCINCVAKNGEGAQKARTQMMFCHKGVVHKLTPKMHLKIAAILERTKMFQRVCPLTETPSHASQIISPRINDIHEVETLVRRSSGESGKIVKTR